MKLRERFVVTLLLIALLLIAPAVYGLFALRELQQVAYNLSTRDAVGALALGRLQTAVSEAESAQRIYLALGAAEPEGAATRARVQEAMADIETALATLAEGGYRQPAGPALQAWARLEQAVAREQALVEAGRIEAADSLRQAAVDPAFEAMDAALTSIGRAINRTGAEQVRLAQRIAAGAATTTLLALGGALLIALLIAGWLARSVLFPIRQLRHGMAEVAEGDFEPEVRIDPARPDEIGDLARSFRRMAAELKALDQLKAEFVSVASHELKTPLSVIRGYVSLLRDGIYGEVPAKQSEVLGSVHDQTDRLGRLIQQLLDISRFEAGGGRLDVKPLALHAFLRDFEVAFEPLAQQNRTQFELALQEPLPDQIRGDADRLNEVVGNLLSNAFKFTPPGGRIVLRARALADGEADDLGGAGVLLEVEDTGVGIPADKLPRIFEKFFQVENEAKPLSVGSGLGLAIAQEIVEAHGGTIGAESEVGRGTRFRIRLPLDPPRLNQH